MPIPAHSLLLAGAPVAAGPWTPASISGLAAWFDSTNAASVISSGSPARVSQWNDISGNGNHVAEATAKPTAGTVTINGLPALDFNSQFLRRATFTQGTLAQPVTFLVVLNPSSVGPGDSVILDGFGTSNRMDLAYSGSKFQYYAGSNQQVGTASTGAQQIVVIYNGASSQLWVNGSSVSTANPGTDSIVGLNIGTFSTGTASLVGKLGEVVVVHGSISAGDRTSWNTYCAKWGL